MEMQVRVSRNFLEPPGVSKGKVGMSTVCNCRVGIFGLILI